MEGICHEDNVARMQRGELYYAFTPELTALRKRCHHAVHRFNNAGEAPRRQLVALFRDILDDKRPLPDESQGDAALDDDPWVETPAHIDYGFNVKFGSNVYVNFNSTFIDTSLISIGSRTLIGPNCSFYSGTHPLDPFLRNGTRGPELGKPITIGEDCWFGGNVIVLPGVTIGRGVTVGAGSVVTKDIPDFQVVAGNPARVLKRIEPSHPDPSTTEHGAEVAMGDQAEKLDNRGSS